MYTTEEWQSEVKAVFTILNQLFEVKLSSACSLHVHVSPLGRVFTADDVKNLFRSALYYELPFFTILPPARKDNIWAKSITNHLHIDLAEVAEQSWAPYFGLADRYNRKDEIFTYLLGETRSLTWNFGQFGPMGCGTIEHRSPPPVKSAQEAIHWVAVTLGCVHNSLHLEDWSDVATTKTRPSTDDLRAAIKKGAIDLGIDIDRVLFQPLLSDNHQPQLEYNSLELEAITKKLADKEKAGSIFAHKVLFSPNMGHSVLNIIIFPTIIRRFNSDFRS